MAVNPNNFYVTLFSNVSMKLYPDNTVGAFTVQLPEEIYLGNCRWEVGLCEFSCPPNVGTYRKIITISETNAMIYSNLIIPVCG